MFPRPIAQRSRNARILYQVALPISLVLWLLPLLGVALTSVRPSSDLAAGNYFGMPSRIAFSNYYDVFANSPIAQYILNSFKVTIPTVIGAVALSCMTGFALGIYRFRSNLLIFFMFVAGNFVPFQILMGPVRDLTLSMGVYNTTAADAPGHCRTFGAGFHLHLERLFLGDRADNRCQHTAGDGGAIFAQRAVGGGMAPRVGRLDHCRAAACGHVLPDAETLHCRFDSRSS